MFVDRISIFACGGDGGRGAMSFRREKYVPRGGPDGGDGGDGGSVILRAVAGADSLAGLTHRKFWRAEQGGAGGPALRHGRRGGDLVIPVPPGTIVRDRDRGNILKDLIQIGDEVTIAHGGRGGRGNKAFATATHQAPREFEPGTAGEERWVILELKVIADAGLVGLPNAGKSTLLSRLSRARPEIADYPFTTKYPNLGLVFVDDDRSFVLADLPGLIEGAHTGVGLGHEFLRHVERTRVLVHLIEPMPTDNSDPIQNYRMIRREIELYSPLLASKPELVVVSKSELLADADLIERMERDIGKPLVRVSAVTGAGLAELVHAIVDLLASIQTSEAPVLHRPVPPHLRPPPSPINAPTET
jgi:GTP-binding protein